ncbi:MAG: DUF1552 domain-containing protein [Myxococcota bacterium]
MRFGRRSFLASAGLGAGASLFLPLLHRIQAEGAGAGARRFVIVVEGNGLHPYNFLSSPARAALAATGANIGADERVFTRRYEHDAPVEASGELASAPALTALAGNAGEPSLEDQAMVVLGLSSKIAGGGHTTNFGALSCAPSNPSTPSAATIDHVLGQMPDVRGSTPFDVVRLGIHEDRGKTNYRTCATGPRTPAPIVCDPTAAFNGLFGSVASAEGQRGFRDRRDLLDFARADANAALAQFSGNSRERLKLERYLESLEVLSGRHDQIVAMEPTLRQVVPEDPTVSPLYESPHPLENLDAMFELATAALIGCLTNVVVIASGTGHFDVTYSSFGAGTPGRHTVCHSHDNALLTAVTERHASFAARMARALRSVPEGEGTMLDHTAILYMSDNGEKHHSKAEEWPALLLGGSALGLRTDGRTVVYPKHGHDNHRQISNLFNTLSYLGNGPIDEFGAEGDSRIAAGPLTEVYRS